MNCKKLMEKYIPELRRKFHATLHANLTGLDPHPAIAPGKPANFIAFSVDKKRSGMITEPYLWEMLPDIVSDEDKYNCSLYLIHIATLDNGDKYVRLFFEDNSPDVLSQEK